MARTRGVAAAAVGVLVVLLAAALGLAQARVIKLTDKNFEHDTQATTGATTGDWFVMFCAPRDSFCKELEPKWAKLGEELLGEINVAKVDVREEPQLTSRFGIRNMPTLLYLHKGKMFKYRGKREVESFMDFVQSIRSGKLTDGEPVPPEPGMFSEGLPLELVKEYAQNPALIGAIGALVAMCALGAGRANRGARAKQH
mmetsp:Transcript_11105/g.35384  ORF Transcript_11105/g.35384 Transcript_11105/m.35384 type:complete len:199 (-) Transcript_11105:62-658(-)